MTYTSYESDSFGSLMSDTNSVVSFFSSDFVKDIKLTQVTDEYMFFKYSIWREYAYSESYFDDSKINFAESPLYDQYEGTDPLI